MRPPIFRPYPRFSASKGTFPKKCFWFAFFHTCITFFLSRTFQGCAYISNWPSTWEDTTVTAIQPVHLAFFGLAHFSDSRGDFPKKNLDLLSSTILLHSSCQDLSKDVLRSQIGQVLGKIQLLQAKSWYKLKACAHFSTLPQIFGFQGDFSEKMFLICFLPHLYYILLVKNFPRMCLHLKLAKYLGRYRCYSHTAGALSIFRPHPIFRLPWGLFLAMGT